MADNVTVDTLAGDPVIATDDDGTAQHQYVKVEFGANGTFSKVATGTGLPVTLDSLLAGENQTFNLIEVSGGSVRTAVLATAVTTNTSSTAVDTVPVGPKTFWAQVAGTGAQTATIAIYGNVTNTNTNGVLIGTITLSGTTLVTDALPVVTANFTWHYIITTNVTGTSASVDVYAMC